MKIKSDSIADTRLSMCKTIYKEDFLHINISCFWKTQLEYRLPIVYFVVRGQGGQVKHNDTNNTNIEFG